MTSPRSVPELLATLQAGDAASLETLVPQAYDELRRLAHRYLGKQRPGNSLQSTSLVDEAYLRLANQQGLHFENERQFFGLAALIMRQILVDYACKRFAAKRDGGFRRASRGGIRPRCGDLESDHSGVHGCGCGLRWHSQHRKRRPILTGEVGVERAAYVLKMSETRFWAAEMRRAPLLELHLGAIAKWPR